MLRYEKNVYLFSNNSYKIFKYSTEIADTRKLFFKLIVRLRFK